MRLNAENGSPNIYSGTYGSLAVRVQDYANNFSIELRESFEDESALALVIFSADRSEKRSILIYELYETLDGKLGQAGSDTSTCEGACYLQNFDNFLERLNMFSISEKALERIIKRFLGKDFEREAEMYDE